MRQIVTKISVVKKPGRRKGIVYRSPRIYLSTKLTDDSMFPFSGADMITVEIVGSRLVISRAKPKGGGRSRGRKKGKQ